MLVLGDTNSCLSVIPAKRCKIPIFHMEAGNHVVLIKEFQKKKLIERIVDHTSDINLTYGSIARDYLFTQREFILIL